MAEKLERLLTFLGERSLYDAVSQCSRCGYCEQACPTYLATGDETRSPRGRNQLVRLMAEGKLQDPGSAEAALSTCLLCGACATVCPAKVPTADIVLEGRRMLREGAAAWSVRLLTGWLIDRPSLFALLLKLGYALKRLGLGALAGRFGHVDEAPRELLFEALARDPELGEAPGADWLYFAACGPNYVVPRVGLATVQVLKARAGRGAWLKNPCCGLVSYNYGELGDARRLAKANIERLERAGGTAPAVVDCSSCAAYLKSYPQLFLDDAAWKARAEAFARRVRDAVEVLPQDLPRVEAAATPPSAGLAGSTFPIAGPATLHDACRARHGQGLVAEPRAAMRSLCSDYRELPEAGECCGGAGAFAFVHPELSEDLLKRKVGHIASTQSRVVAASSTSCLLQLARGLKAWYPECRVVHPSELAAEALEKPPA